LATTMRLLVEILIVGGLIYLGWDTSFKQRVDQVHAGVNAVGQAVSKRATPSAETAAAPAPQVRPIIQATPQHGSWMWDPNHHAPLDRPTPTPGIRP
jgi:hypothetical protein